MPEELVLTDVDADEEVVTTPDVVLEDMTPEDEPLGCGLCPSRHASASTSHHSPSGQSSSLAQRSKHASQAVAINTLSTHNPTSLAFTGLLLMPGNICSLSQPLIGGKPSILPPRSRLFYQALCCLAWSGVCHSGHPVLDLVGRLEVHKTTSLDENIMPLQALWILALTTVSTGDNPLAVFALGDTPESVNLATQVRQQCLGNVPGTLSAEETSRRLLGALSGSQVNFVTLEAGQAALARAQQLYADGRFQDCVSAIEKIVVQLEADDAWTAQKEELLTKARLYAVHALITVAGNKETGRAVTPEGRKARDHLVRLLASQPLYQLDPAQYAPKFRLLMDHARKTVSEAKRGQLVVKLIPGEPTLFVEGHPVGKAPVGVTLLSGSYRVWLEKDGRRSIARRVQIGEGVQQLEVDFQLESQLDTFDLKILATADDVPQALLMHISKAVGNGSVALVQKVTDQADVVARMVVYNAPQGTIRKGAITKDQAPPVQALSRFALSGNVSLSSSNSVAKARVWMDDVLLGETPLPVMQGLAEGTHRFTVRLNSLMVEKVAVLSAPAYKVVVTSRDGQLQLNVEADTSPQDKPQAASAPTDTPVPSQSNSRSHLWMVPMGLGVGLMALGLPAVLTGLATVSSAVIGIALYPKNEWGMFKAYPNESMDQTEMRVRLTGAAAVSGAALMGLGLLVGLVGVVGLPIGLLLR